MQRLLSVCGVFLVYKYSYVVGQDPDEGRSLIIASNPR